MAELVIVKPEVNQTLVLRRYHTYGRDLFYPVCFTSSCFATLLKQKTLNDRDLYVIRLMGFTITFQKEV